MKQIWKEMIFIWLIGIGLVYAGEIIALGLLSWCIAGLITGIIGGFLISLRTGHETLPLLLATLLVILATVTRLIPKFYQFWIMEFDLEVVKQVASADPQKDAVVRSLIEAGMTEGQFKLLAMAGGIMSICIIIGPCALIGALIGKKIYKAS